jgi:hypothetical protein
MATTPTNEPDRGQWTSASSAQADALCPGRHLAQRGLPDVRATDSREHGREIHEALKKQDPTGLSVEQVDTYDACNDIDRRALMKFFGPEIANAPPTTEREKRLWVQWPDGLRHSGQPDLIYRKGVKALIVEYKTLFGDIPESSRNLQLRDQVCLYYANTPLIKEIGTMVNQPMVTREPEICLYSEEHIVRARDEMYFRVKASNTEGSHRIPGELQCKYCRAAAAANCKEYRNWASEMVVVDTRLVVAIQERAVADWDPQMRAEFCERMSIAQKWLDDMKAEMKRLLAADPNAIPGWELKPGAAINDLINPQKIFDAFSQKGGSLEQFLACIDISSGRLKDALAHITKAKGKALKAEIDAVIGENVLKGQKDASLKRKK